MQNLKSINITPTIVIDDLHALESVVLDASAKLNLYEQRLFLLVVNATKGNEIVPDSPIILEASTYVETFGGDIQLAHKELKLACDNIFEREFTFRRVSSSGSTIVARSRWVSQIGYNDKEKYVLLCLTPAIINILKTLEEEFSNLF